MWACPIEDEFFTDDTKYRRDEQAVVSSARTRHANRGQVEQMQKDLKDFKPGEEFLLDITPPVILNSKNKKGKGGKGPKPPEGDGLPEERKKPKNLLITVINYSMRLQALSKSIAAEYLSEAKKFSAKLEELDRAWISSNPLRYIYGIPVLVCMGTVDDMMGSRERGY